MSDFSKVKEINVVNEMSYANKHLANGWVLIAVNSVSGNDGKGSNRISTEYVLGWENALPSKSVPKDDAKQSKYAPQYQDDTAVSRKLAKPKPQPKRITIID